MTNYIEFRDRSFPKAYFISFRGYGTWLHGDRRLSMDRNNFNRFGQGKIPANADLEQKELSNLKNMPIAFNREMREVIQQALYEVCNFRKYHLVAVNVRTNHVHAVVNANEKPELIMNSFKSYATRRLRELKCVSPATKIWSRHGSTRYLWTELQVSAAVDYVINGQGDDLPGF